MDIEDHILFKIVTTYDLLYKLRAKHKIGDLSWEEYAALMEPKCVAVMQELIQCLESGDFLQYHRKNMEIPDEPNVNGRTSYGYPFQSTSEFAIRRYGEFLDVYRSALLQPDPEKRTRELVIGFDSFAGWMHGSFTLSQQVMYMRPITGDHSQDYDIALHTLYLVTAKYDASAAIDYLRRCARENKFIKEKYVKT